MKRQTHSGLVVGLLFLLAPRIFAAQDIPAPAAIPDSRAEWTVEIRTSGGLDGQGNGGFTVTAAGALTCNLTAPCSRQIQKPELQSIEGFVNSANLASPIPVSPSVCSDCIMTTMYLRIRDSKGMEWSYVVSWDLTTQSKVPADFKQIFRAAMALTQ